MIFASNNLGKVKQIKDLCNNMIDVLSLKDAKIDIDVVEDGKTLEENAIKKALEVHKFANDEVLSDDSGLFIDFFDGWPGVYTHRFIPNCTAEERNLAILDKMKNVDDSLRGAKVRCVLAYCDKNGKVKTYLGELKCKITFEQRGSNTFGFDNIIELSNGKTLAEFSDQEKEKINARGLAFKKFLDDYNNHKINL